MKKSLFYLICAIMGGLIAALGLLIAKKFGFAVSVNKKVTAGFAVTAATFAALTPAVREKIRHVCCDLDWAEEVCRGYNAIPRLYRKSFWQLFGFINLAFLFHTVNFMWGNRDWAAVRFAVDPAQRQREGR